MNDREMNGKVISEIFYEELREFVNKTDKHPKIVDISIGDDFASKKYVNIKKKTFKEKTKIDFFSVHFEKITSFELIDFIKKLNNDPLVHGIMIQLPLPKYLLKDERLILDSILVEKDIDGLTSTSLGLLDSCNRGFVPCTALGIEFLLKAYNISLKGKLVAVVNRSNIIGKPVAKLLLKDDATVIMCHSKTENLKDITKKCDIVIIAINKEEYFDSDFFMEDAIVIDCGVHKNINGKIVGDVKYNDVINKVSLITPAINGIGPMTICMLAYNSYKTIYKDIDLVLDNVLKRISNN